MKLISRVSDKEMLLQPLAWRRAVAYHCLATRVTVLAPVPLNWLLGWWHTALVPTLLRGHRARWLQRIEKAHEAAAYKSYLDGYRQGLIEGGRDTKKALLDGLTHFIETRGWKP